MGGRLEVPHAPAAATIERGVPSAIGRTVSHIRATEPVTMKREPMPELRGEQQVDISEIMEAQRKESGVYSTNHLFPGVSPAVLKRREEGRTAEE